DQRIGHQQKVRWHLRPLRPAPPFRQLIKRTFYRVAFSAFGCSATGPAGASGSKLNHNLCLIIRHLGSEMIRTVTQEVAKRSDPLSRCLDRSGRLKRGYDTANHGIGKREITWFSPLMMCCYLSVPVLCA